MINDLIVGTKNRDSNVNVRFHQQDTLESVFARLETRGCISTVKDGLRLLFGRNRRDGREALPPFQHKRQPLCAPIR